MQRSAKVGIGIGVVSAAMLVGAGYAISDLAGGGSHPGTVHTAPVAAAQGSTPAAQSPGLPPRAQGTPGAPLTADQASATAKSFLDAWASGNLTQAAAQTDDPSTAITTLTAFHDKLQPTAMSFTPTGGGTGATAGGTPVAFKASITFAKATGPWVYDGSLAVVQQSDGTDLVHWTPTVINPRLTQGGSISVQPLPATPSDVVDRNGKSLAGFPSLAPLLNQLKAAAQAPAAGTSGSSGTAGTSGTAGSAVQLNLPGGSTPVPLFTITAPAPQPPLRLTLDATLQAAAETAAQQQSQGGTRPTSLVAIEPSTGDVLAIANAPANGPNNAFLAEHAPGSTMKVITAAALLEAGDSPSSTVACPSQTMVTGQPLHNDFPDARLDNRLQDDFAQSCNTAFINESTRLLTPSTLPAEAKDVFGLGLDWKTGLTDLDTVIPVVSDPASAATEYIGQSTIKTNALAMASVAATVQNGTFRQPIVVPGLPQQPAARQLSGGVLSDLRSMMLYTTKNGTAASVPGGIPSDVGSKTGTAEVNGQLPNSWFIGFRGNLAVACEVQGGSMGVDAAGPAAVAVLRAGNG
ncbi:penicillin-binding transpeptidase domain-containing protein [Kitasatospora sp. LaBMicrA B282]|uniref:penicillin-binding transpeptidase domain-containing protein n=1 Tax=Kitasatospora sp. LaBMicrA B282 TaxID=3420949 RepID=UPI003D0BE9CF